MISRRATPERKINLPIGRSHFLFDLLKSVAAEDEAESHQNTLGRSRHVTVPELVDAVDDSGQPGKVYLVAVKKRKVHVGHSFTGGSPKFCAAC